MRSTLLLNKEALKNFFFVFSREVMNKKRKERIFPSKKMTYGFYERRKTGKERKMGFWHYQKIILHNYFYL